jgi:hypothetical protein
MEKARPITDVTSTTLLKNKKCRYAFRIFGTYGLKEGAMWRVDPLLRNDREISKYTTAATK